MMTGSHYPHWLLFDAQMVFFSLPLVFVASFSASNTISSYMGKDSCSVEVIDIHLALQSDTQASDVHLIFFK